MAEALSPATLVTVTVGELYDLMSLTLHEDRSSLVTSILTRQPPPTNFSDAVALVNQLYDVRAVIRELKSAFASRGELDGGVKAVLDHPLYLSAMAEQNRLHDALMELV